MINLLVIYKSIKIRKRRPVVAFERDLSPLAIQYKSHMCLQIGIDQLTDAIQTGSHNTQRAIWQRRWQMRTISRDTDKVVDQLSRQKR